MKKITMDVLKDAANRLLFSMSEEEYEALFKEFQTMTKLMGKIAENEEVDQVEPMTFPFDCETTYLREDIPGETLTPEEALKNAGSKEDDQIKLPRVVLWVT